jgi:hypothetical protein
MAFLKKDKPATEPFIVPSLTSHPDYAALVEKRRGLHARHATVRAEKRDIERQIAETPAPAMRPGVAELLEEASDSTTGLRARLAELNTFDRDIDAALEVLRQRLAAARTVASKAVCAQVREEYGRRVADICKALEAADAAHRSYIELRDDLEANDIAWGSLTPLIPTFLGDIREADRRVVAYIAEARRAGYVD